MTRTDRLLSLVARLQTGRWQRAEDIAQTLGVSVRTIYRDMQALEEAGVPVVAVPGKGYRLGQQKETSHRIGLHAVPLETFEHPSDQAILRPLREALSQQQVVRFRYRSDRTADEESEQRTVCPYGLLRRSGKWQCVGYDRERQQVQHFVLRRMDNLEVLDESFDRPSSYGLSQDVDMAREVTVRVRFAPAVASWVQKAPPVYTEQVGRDGEALLLTLRVQREEEVLPWLLSWGRHVQVLEPASLRRRLATEARNIAAHYQLEPDLLI